VNARKEGDEASVIGGEERVDYVGKPRAKGVLVASMKLVPMCVRNIATCMGPVSPCAKWG
jgi:hypothetical protein